MTQSLQYSPSVVGAAIVEVPNPGHPYGVRKVGEVPIVPPPAAIAIYRALGVRMTSLPMSPARILEAQWARYRTRHVRIASSSYQDRI